MVIERSRRSARRAETSETPKTHVVWLITQRLPSVRARACPRHAVAVLEKLARARVVWDDTRGINEHEAIALRIAEERSQLSRTGATAPSTRRVTGTACSGGYPWDG